MRVYSCAKNRAMLMDSITRQIRELECEARAAWWVWLGLFLNGLPNYTDNVQCL